MNKIGLIVLLLFSAPGQAKVPSLKKVRLLYQEAVTKKESCKKLIDMLAPYNEKNHPLLLGYKASATMMMARHVLSPFEKLTYFNEGKSMLQKAVRADEDNTELRFLRFSIQTQAPRFLGYNDEIALDKTFLLQSIPQLSDKTLREVIILYLKDTGCLTDNETQNLTTWKNY